MSSSGDTNNTCEICGNKAIRKCVVIDNRKVCTDCAKKIIENVEIDDEIKTSTEQTLTEVKEKISGSKGKYLFWAVIFGGLIIIITACFGFDNKGKEAQYMQGIDFIKNYRYSDAAVKFFNSDYKNSKILYSYANAQDSRVQDPSLAEHYLKQIPQNYSGEFSEDIKKLRESIKEPAQKQRQENMENEKEKQEIAAKERATHVYVGDSQYKVVQVLGEPKHKNRTVTTNGAREQWVYSNKYIYIENGVVVGFQD